MAIHWATTLNLTITPKNKPKCILLGCFSIQRRHAQVSLVYKVNLHTKDSNFKLHGVNMHDIFPEMIYHYSSRCPSNYIIKLPGILKSI